MIELAPRSKTGLALTNPVMIASGCCGYGDAYRHLIDLSLFGAVVTQAVTLRPRRGANQPRLAEIEGGFILNTDHQNPGVKRVLSRYAKVWSRSPAPVIAHLPADDPADLQRTARALTDARTDQLAGLELGIPPGARLNDIESWVRTIQQVSELPLLVKLPLGSAREMAIAAAKAQVDTLVIGSLPLATGSAADQSLVNGHLYHPLLLHMVLSHVQGLADLGVPIIASGGIHSTANVRLLLEAGAAAIQLDSLLFIDPKGAEAIAAEFSERVS